LNTQKIESLLKTYPSCAADNAGPFVLQESTVSSLQILEDIPCDYEDWVETEEKSEWVARTLKIFFFAQKKFTMINKWARWPELFLTPDA
jgi:hypothetical protein